MENYLALRWLEAATTNSHDTWIYGLYGNFIRSLQQSVCNLAELGVCVLVMTALPVFLLWRRRRQSGNNTECLEHRLRVVPWHMQKEIENEMLKFHREQLELRKEKKLSEATSKTVKEPNK